MRRRGCSCVVCWTKGGLLLPLLHLPEIVLRVTRSSDQARQTQAVRQIINATGVCSDAELRGEDPLVFYGSQITHVVGSRRIAQRRVLNASC
jgi:hypothetical protein